MSNILTPPTTLLYGDVGTGKTSSLATYAKAGLKLFILFTDPGGEQSLLDRLIQLQLPIDNIHWHYVGPKRASWDNLQSAAKRVGGLSYEDLTSLKSAGKSPETQYLNVLSCLSNLTCDRTGEEFGPIESLDNTWAFCLDSLSGFNTHAFDMVVGGKPTAHKGEYGVGMRMEEWAVTTLISDHKCFLCITAHPRKVTNELTGERNIAPSFLGQNLNEQVPRLFDDVIWTRKEYNKFTWSTSESKVVTKNRNVPLGDNLDPDFGAIVNSWRRRIQFSHGGAEQQEAEPRVQPKAQPKVVPAQKPVAKT